MQKTTDNKNNTKQNTTKSNIEPSRDIYESNKNILINHYKAYIKDVKSYIFRLQNINDKLNQCNDNIIDLYGLEDKDLNRLIATTNARLDEISANIEKTNIVLKNTEQDKFPITDFNSDFVTKQMNKLNSNWNTIQVYYTDIENNIKIFDNKIKDFVDQKRQYLISKNEKLCKSKLSRIINNTSNKLYKNNIKMFEEDYNFYMKDLNLPSFWKERIEIGTKIIRAVDDYSVEYLDNKKLAKYKTAVQDTEKQSIKQRINPKLRMHQNSTPLTPQNNNGTYNTKKIKLSQRPLSQQQRGTPLPTNSLARI